MNIYDTSLHEGLAELPVSPDSAAEPEQHHRRWQAILLWLCLGVIGVAGIRIVAIRTAPTFTTKQPAARSAVHPLATPVPSNASTASWPILAHPAGCPCSIKYPPTWYHWEAPDGAPHDILSSVRVPPFPSTFPRPGGSQAFVDFSFGADGQDIFPDLLLHGQLMTVDGRSFAARERRQVTGLLKGVDALEVYIPDRTGPVMPADPQYEPPAKAHIWDYDWYYSMTMYPADGPARSTFMQMLLTVRFHPAETLQHLP